MLKYAIVAFLMTSTAAIAADDTFTDTSDFGHITCMSPSGDEIKESKTFRATNDRFFKKSSITVGVHSGWAPKKHGCDLQGVEETEITVQSEAGPIQVPVVTAFTIYAYADCGTNIAQYAGKTAAIACTTSAITSKFSHK
ncbi:hypothetical protein OSH10_08435 [Kaistia defluvii]|uniref:hypothetical protein n=1 Tax=Kaistia defluvii TaxID=410841 RepID=UPI0022577AB3|nr:hypothetical protein [Kaistia defluvii]MCX5518461.1 hypothetical protein [Kaistia defluvii]